jgi:hypothetical protein
MKIRATDPEGWRYQAYLNGEKLDHCIEADTDEGWAKVAIFVGRIPMGSVIVRGNVELRLADGESS